MQYEMVRGREELRARENKYLIPDDTGKTSLLNSKGKKHKIQSPPKVIKVHEIYLHCFSLATGSNEEIHKASHIM